MSGFSPRTDPFPIESGGQPSWIAGYVPPAAEWNHWWSVKADVDDPRLTGGPFLPLTGGTLTGLLTLVGMPVGANDAATKAYVDQFTPVTGPFLPVSGGTMTGILTLASNPVGPFDAVPKQYADAIANTTISTTVIANNAVPSTGGAMTGPLVLSGNPSVPLGAATKQYVDQFLPLSGGTITGSLNVNNNLEGAYLYAANGFYANAFNGWEWVFEVENSTGSKIQQYRSGWYDAWSGTDGSRSWVGGNVSLMALDGSGNLSVHGSVSSGGNLSLAGTAYVTGNVVASANVTANAAYATNGLYTISDGSHGMFVSGSGPDRYVRFNTNFQFHFVNSTGNLLWENPYGVMLVTDYASSFFYNNQGHLGGYGAYQNLSDDRFKMSVVPASYGLTEILRLAPIRFARISRRSGDSYEPRSEIGFSAQQVREVIPEAVMAVGVELADGTGGLDSDDPTLAIGYDAITAALVNAVKQLSDAVKDIDGRLSAAMRA